MQPEFIEIQTKDGLYLPGLFYVSKASKKVAIFLHGNGSSSVFYNEKVNKIFAEELNKKGISTLYFNNRGAHLIKIFKKEIRGKLIKKRFGMAYEKIKDCVFDIEGAIFMLKQRGYEEIFLVGFSTGANKIAVFNFYKPKNKVSKYVLICGGDDTGIYYNAFGPNKFQRLLLESKQKIKNKKGEELIKDILPELFSYNSFYDIANPDGDYNIFPFYEVLHKIKLSTKPLFRYFSKIKKESLVVYGDKDEYAYGNVPKIVEILKQQNPNLKYEIIKGADHSFYKYERELANKIALFLKQNS